MVLIILRRFLAVLLIDLFIVLFLVVLVVLRVNATVPEPDFYISQLQKADIYNFPYGDWVAVEVDKRLKDVKDPPVSKLITGREALSYAKRVAPPEWLQAQAEQVIGQVGSYANGDRDSFTITVKLQDRAEAAMGVLRDFVGDPDTYTFLFDEVIEPAVRDNMKAIADLPFGLKVTDQQIVDGIKEIAPQPWVQAQVANIVDNVGPYITGRKDTFTLTVPLADRADAALGVLRGFLRDANIYDFLFDQVIAPAVQQNLGSAVQLPFGITVTGQEVVGAVKQVVTRDWAQAQVDNVLDTVGPYITGRTDSFTLAVDLADRKQAAIRVVDELADRKLRALFDGLPICTPQQLQELLLRGLGTQLPPCKPAGFTYEQLKVQLGIDITTPVRQFIGDQLPNTFTFTDADLRRILREQGSTDTLDRLDDVRKVLRDGLTLTDADLRQLLTKQGSADTLDQLDDARKVLREGWTFTDKDARRLLTEQQGGSDTLQQIDQVRAQVHRARRLVPLLFLVLAVFPVLVGFLGGRGWWGRLRWASIAFALAAAVTFAAAIVGQGYVPTLVDMIDLPSGDMPPQVADKVREVVTNVASDFIGGIRGQALTYLIIGLLGLVGSIVGQVVLRPTRPSQPPGAAVDGGAASP